MKPLVQKIHHVAYRCKDALETARWYEKHLGMQLVLSIAEDAAPSTGESDPYTTSSSTPAWATRWCSSNCPPGRRWAATRAPRGPSTWPCRVESMEVLLAGQARPGGCWHRGARPDRPRAVPVDYLSTNGDRLELAARRLGEDVLAALDQVKWAMLSRSGARPNAHPEARRVENARRQLQRNVPVIRPRHGRTQSMIDAVNPLSWVPSANGHPDFP